MSKPVLFVIVVISFSFSNPLLSYGETNQKKNKAGQSGQVSSIEDTILKNQKSEAERTKRIWRYGINPEVWYIRQKKNYRDSVGNIVSDGRQFGLQFFASKNVNQNNLTFYLNLRTADINSDSDYVDSKGSREFYDDIRWGEVEFLTRYLFMSDNSIAHPYIVGGTSYNKSREITILTTPGWYYPITGTNKLERELDYFTLSFGFGYLFNIMESWHLKAEFVPNFALLKQRFKNNITTVNAKTQDSGFGYNAIATLVYEFSDRINIQFGIKDVAINQ